MIDTPAKTPIAGLAAEVFMTDAEISSNANEANATQPSPLYRAKVRLNWAWNAAFSASE